MQSSNKIRNCEFDLKIFSDASLSFCIATGGGPASQYFWSHDDKIIRINFLEIKAVLLALKWYASSLTNLRILLSIDDITAVTYNHKMGSEQESPSVN